MNKKEKWVGDHPFLFGTGIAWAGILIAMTISIAMYAIMTIGIML